MARRARLAIIALVVLAVVGAGVWWYESRVPAPVTWQGYAEADYVKVGPTLQGLLTDVSVARGDRVQQGTPLFTQDDANDRAGRDQAAALLKQAEDNLKNLESGGKPTEIEEAEANLADAQSTLVRVRADLGRAETLLRSGIATKQNVDQLRADNRSAEAKVQALTAALAQMRAPMGRDAEIAAQHTAVEAARAALGMAEWRLAQRRIIAPAGGVVADVLARPGETMAAGAPVVSLLPPENIFVRFFVPEAALAGLHRGDAVALRCDACPAGLVAAISFISPQAEYTPPVIYSEESRAKLVYMIDARTPPGEAARLNPGQPIEVRPLAAGGKP